MAKRSNHKRKQSFTIPLAVLAGAAIPAEAFVRDYKAGGVKLGVQGLLARLTGVNVNADHYDWQIMMREGLGPILAGYLVHKFVGQKLGVNRALSSAGVPFIRI